MAIRYDELNPYTTPDPIMPLLPPNTEKKWIEEYHCKCEGKRKQLNFLVEQENTHQIDLANNALFGPNLTILLPEYDPTKPFPIVLPKYDPTILMCPGPTSSPTPFWSHLLTYT
eukprot:13270138-Ditylum_brightwellii.AAC.1